MICNYETHLHIQPLYTNPGTQFKNRIHSVKECRGKLRDFKLKPPRSFIKEE